MIDLSGKKCAGLVSIEAWIDDELVNDLVALYLKTDDQVIHKIYLDDKDSVWKIEKTSELPKPEETPDGKKPKFTKKNIASENKLMGKEIANFRELDQGHSAVGKLSFGDGTLVLLTYIYMTKDLKMKVMVPEEI